jgi:hypothetical protein
LRLFENILVPKFGAKIRRWDLKTENDRKKDTLEFSAATIRFFQPYTSQRNPQKMMKKLLLVLCLSMTILACTKSTDSSDDGHIAASQVPSTVMSTYNTRYPAASGQIEWEIEHGNTYKVKFFIGSQRWQAQFKTDGTFIDEKMI